MNPKAVRRSRVCSTDPDLSAKSSDNRLITNFQPRSALPRSSAAPKTPTSSDRLDSRLDMRRDGARSTSGAGGGKWKGEWPGLRVMRLLREDPDFGGCRQRQLSGCQAAFVEEAATIREWTELFWLPLVADISWNTAEYCQFPGHRSIHTWSRESDNQRYWKSTHGF